MNSSEVFQALLDGVIAGSIWGMMAIGFGLILGVTGRFHFAFATTFVLSTYVAAHLNNGGIPLYIAIVLGIIAGTLFGVACELILYKPLVARIGANALLGVFVTALGVVIVGENVIRLLWGSNSLTLSTGYNVSRISFGNNVGVTNLDVIIVVVSAILTLGSWAFIKYAKYGRAIRAVQENPDMANAIGVHPESVYVFVFALGSALCGIAAVLYTQRGAGAPDAGVEPTFTALVAMFLAGLRSSPIGFMVAGILIGLLQNVSVIWINGLWSPVITFGILFVYLALTPFFEGRKIRLPSIRARTSAPAET